MRWDLNAVWIDPVAVGKQLQDPLPHFTGGLVGESNSQNAVRLDALMQEIANAPRNDARLAAAGPRQDEEGSFRVCDCLRLGGRQVGEQVLFSARHPASSPSAALRFVSSDFTARLVLC